MKPPLLFALKLFLALGCGLMAGVFFAFSTFVMAALARLPASQGIAAMQLINIRVLNPLFMGVFMGAAAASVAGIVVALRSWHQPGAAFLLAGCLLYLVGTFGVTAAFNVPLNDALATLKPDDAASAPAWASFVSSWTIWNHVRTIAALSASASLILALCQQQAG